MRTWSSLGKPLLSGCVHTLPWQQYLLITFEHCWLLVYHNEDIYVQISTSPSLFVFAFVFTLCSQLLRNRLETAELCCHPFCQVRHGFRLEFISHMLGAYFIHSYNPLWLQSILSYIVPEVHFLNLSFFECHLVLLNRLVEGTTEILFGGIPFVSFWYKSCVMCISCLHIINNSQAIDLEIQQLAHPVTVSKVSFEKLFCRLPTEGMLSNCEGQE